MQLRILFILILVSTNLISMWPMVTDEVIMAIAARRFKQETVSPALLTINLPSPLEISPVDAPAKISIHSDSEPSIPQQVNKTSMPSPKIGDSVLDGKSYILHFSLSKKTRAKSRPQLTDWFNSVLDSLSCSTDSNKSLALCTSFSLKTGKLRSKKNYKPKPKPYEPPNGVHQAARIQKTIEGKITKEQAQQWMYFKQKETKKTRKKRA